MNYHFPYALHEYSVDSIYIPTIFSTQIHLLTKQPIVFRKK